MSRLGVLGDFLSARWLALTSEQRIDWHFTAALRPRVGHNGKLRTLNGWQYYVSVNENLAVIDTNLLLDDPPPDDEKPSPQNVTLASWPLPAQPATGPSVRRVTPQVVIENGVAVGTAMIMTQGYFGFSAPRNPVILHPRITLTNGDTQTWLTTDNPPEYITIGQGFLPPTRKTTQNINPRTRHVRVAAAGETGPLSLAESDGYFATTGGVNRFSKIKGYTMTRRPDRPAGRVKVINTTNGARINQTIPNPTGTT